MIKLKKNFSPIGTRQLVRTHLSGGYSWIPYRVMEVTGEGSATPSDGVIVYFELADKHPSTPAQYIALPLKCFDQRVLPETKEDAFWIVEKEELDL